MAAYCMPFIVVAPCLAPTAFTRKQYWQSGDEYHISHHWYIKYICLLQRVFVNSSSMSPVQTPVFWSSVQTFIDIQPCEWGKKKWFVSVIDRYVTFHHRSSLIPACKLCSERSWQCMGTHGSTILAAHLFWGSEEDATGNWIPLWTIQSDVSAVCM